MKKLIKTNEFTIFVIIAVMWIAFGIVNPHILSLANFYSITRASIISATAVRILERRLALYSSSM